MALGRNDDRVVHHRGIDLRRLRAVPILFALVVCFEHLHFLL